MANWIWEFGYLWWNVVVLSAAKATLLLGVAGVLARLMSRRSPSARCWVWGTALAAAAAMPLVATLTPNWQILPPWLNARILSPSLGNLSSTVGLGELASPALSWLTGLVAIAWLAGVALLFVRSLLAASLLRRWAKGSDVLTADHELAVTCREIQNELGIRSAVSILLSHRDVVPMTWGLIQTRLLLPRDSEKWGKQRLRAVLLHELGHVRRRDGLGQILVQWVCACYWFHPMVWSACEQLRYERETACDDVVLSAGVKATDYAESLLHLSHPLSNAWRIPLTAVAMAEPKALESRIHEILSADRQRSPLPLAQAVVAFALIGASLFGLSVLAPIETGAMNRLPNSNVAEFSPSPQAIESNQYVHQPLELSPESLISIDGSIESESKTRFAAAPDIVSFRRSSRVGKSLTSNHHEPSLLLQLDAVRAQAMLADVIEPENDQAGSKPSTDSPLRRATPSTRIRTAGGFHSPPAPRRNPLDTRDRVSQTSPRGSTSLSDRRPMSL
jgi:beta-lactamase regulating signal transducer with metallopeptidase domain